MKNLILFGLLTLISLKTNAQQFVGDDFRNNYRNVKINTSKNSSGDNIEGNPFTTEDFIKGNVKGYKNDFFFKYNAFNDQMLVRRNESQISIVNKEMISEITFNNGSKYMVVDYVLDGIETEGYLEVLLRNSTTMISLFKKEIIMFQPATKPVSGYDKEKPATFKKSRSRYLVSTKNGAIVSLNKKKEFLNLFPKNKKDLEKYIKSNLQKKKIS